MGRAIPPGDGRRLSFQRPPPPEAQGQEGEGGDGQDGSCPQVPQSR